MTKYFFAGRFINELGKYCTMVALWVLLINVRHFNATHVAIFFGVFAFGALGGGWIGGRISDRFSPKVVLILSEIGLAVSMAVFIHLHRFVFFCLLEVIYGMFSTWSDTGLTSLIPRVVEEKFYTQANTQLITVSSLGVVIGPLIAKVIVDHFGVSAAIYFDVATYVAGILVVALLVLNEKKDHHMPENATHLSETLRGWKFFLQSPLMLGVRCWLGSEFVMAGAASFEPAYAREILHRPVTYLAFAATGIGVGFIVAAYPYLKNDAKNISISRARVMIIGSAIFGALYVLTPSVFIFIAAVFVWGICWKHMMIYVATEIQHNSPPELIGTVSSVNMTLVSFMRIPAAGLVAVGVPELGVRTTIYIFAALSMSAALWFAYFSRNEPYKTNLAPSAHISPDQ